MTKPAADPKSKFLQAKTCKAKAGPTIEYLVFLPANYSARSTNRWPLILSLHGAGERGTNVWRAAIHGPSNYIEKHPDFPFILVSPLCPEREHWSNGPLLALLDEAARKYRVDPARVYLTGLSMGGYGAWDLATSCPERFAAFAPVCGGGEYISVLLTKYDGRHDALKSLPVWAFHGGKDNVVPVAESERMVKFLKDYEVREVKLTVYPEAQHNSWTQTYDNPELYSWFLSHRRDSTSSTR
jgi:predicted peptidase